MKQIMFQCKTDGSYQIKVIAEILNNIIKMGFFEINENGIFLSMLDPSRKTMVSIELLSENFSVFNFNHPKPIFIGINTSHFFKVLKSIKKKDTLEFIIDALNPNELIIRTTPKECNRVSLSVIKIQSAQNLEVNRPEGYVNKSIILPSNDFTKMVKDLQVVGSNVLVIESGYDYVKFIADTDTIIKRCITFGTIENETKETSTFSFDKIDRISKMSCFNTPIHVFASTAELPLQFKTAIGNLGTMRVFIKSNEMSANESGDAS